jgi:glycerol-3-phosphate dehydrogenase subunit B
VALTASVVVIGGGLSGACAALAARESGADVLLVSRAPGATAVSSGAIDFAAAPGDVSIGEAAQALARRRGHPYALLGDGLRPAIDEAIALLRRHLGALGIDGARSSADRNLWLATPLGQAKPAALAQATIAAGDLRALAARRARVGIVAIAGAQAVEAALVARGLSRWIDAVPVHLDSHRTREDALRTVAELAQDLDRPAQRARIGESLGRAAASTGATHLLVPTLGYLAPLEARAELEKQSGATILEALGAPPSVPGMRLYRALQRALEAAGVRRVDGIAERSADGGLQVVRGVECEPVRAGAVVLASGRFVGGGIASAAQGGALRETVLGLPAWAGDRRSIVALPTEELFAAHAGGNHPGLAAGLRADSELRPLDEASRPARAGTAPVFACGAALGGFDPARDDGGLGACAVTGLSAGRRAAAAAGSGA